MSIVIKDKDLDNELQKIVINLQGLGIKASKTDAIRWILYIKKQGKKTNRKWGSILG